jgi:hypothetical protein
MHVLEHPPFAAIDSNPLHGCIDRVPSRYVPHAGVSKSGMAGLKLGYQPVDFLLKGLWFGTRKDLLPSALNQRLPVHSIHGGIEMLGLHQSADLVENLRALFKI